MGRMMEKERVLEKRGEMIRELLSKYEPRKQPVLQATINRFDRVPMKSDPDDVVFLHRGAATDAAMVP